MIIQIIPANGWYAMFRKPTTGLIYREPIICWALCEHPVTGTVGSFREVTGLNREGKACSDFENFVKYVYDTNLKD